MSGQAKEWVLFVLFLCFKYLSPLIVNRVTWEMIELELSKDGAVTDIKVKRESGRTGILPHLL